MTSPADHAAGELLAAWESWDDKPGNDERARRMEDACQTYAPGQASALRAHLARCRRHGMNRAEALASWDPTAATA